MATPQRGKELAIEARRVEVARLTHMGWSTRRIAAEIGVSHGTVATDVDAILTELAAHQTKDAEKIRARELETLAQAEAAVLKVLDRAEAEDFEMVLKATDRVAKIQERRAKLLGLDAPERLDATLTEGPSPEAAARAIREVFAVSKTHGDDDPDAGRTAGDASAADGSGAGSQ
jgi:AcrR family transcriptional regulator